jgi:hypothetical protein
MVKDPVKEIFIMILVIFIVIFCFIFFFKIVEILLYKMNTICYAEETITKKKLDSEGVKNSGNVLNAIKKTFYYIWTYGMPSLQLLLLIFLIFLSYAEHKQLDELEKKIDNLSTVKTVAKQSNWFNNPFAGNKRF